ncbi:hypothetical protein ALC56_14392 [Trachymyrmex septentrionalis]|uniref:Uncharacterized protein n=1 Tax=Trachymyrmex septentrionalis TaxID=34720 RepID=A0A195ETM5_9HYME|nr:hypothetical protein ALC56_14392 [Trachymyrmex septentrionalis]
MWLMLLIRNGTSASIRIRSRLIIGINLFRERIHLSIRGIAVLSADYSPNASTAVAFVLHSDDIPACEAHRSRTFDEYRYQ